MPNKKSKAGASTGKTTDPQSLPVAPVTTPTAQPQAPGAIEPSAQTHPQAQSSQAKGTPSSASSSTATEDFWAKNARAKALIMSTLVPGSEPWKIAEPLELASDIWKALEDKYAPKDNKSRLDAKGIIDAAKKSEGVGGAGGGGDVTAETPRPSSSDFIGDWVEGKPMDKYLDMYRSSKKAMTQPLPESVDATGAVQHASTSDGKHAVEMATAVSTSTTAEHVSQAQSNAPESSASSLSWRATPVVHGSYLTEQQALAFAQYDVERKKQIQVAATKVLMQKLPTRDLRFLWAILYGGEDAPWPGSSSAVIPGVTVSAALATFRVNPV